MKLAVIATFISLVSHATGRVVEYLPKPHEDALKSRSEPAVSNVSPLDAVPGNTTLNFSDESTQWRNPPPVPANTETWRWARCKGQRLINMMYYSDYDAGLEFTPQRNSAQSPYGYGTQA